MNRSRLKLTALGVAQLRKSDMKSLIDRIKEATPEQVEAVDRILQERSNQTQKWGEQNHDMFTWLAILHEETGELSEACLHEKFGGPERNNVFKEAVQIAAVACQIVEFLLRERDKAFAADRESGGRV